MERSTRVPATNARTTNNKTTRGRLARDKPIWSLLVFFALLETVIWLPATATATNNNPAEVPAEELAPFLHTKPSRHEFHFPSSVADTANTIGSSTIVSDEATSSSITTNNSANSKPQQQRGHVRRRNRVLSQHYTSEGVSEMGHASATMEMHHQAEIAHPEAVYREDDDHYHDVSTTDHDYYKHHHHKHAHNPHYKHKDPYELYSKSKSKGSKSYSKYAGAVKASEEEENFYPEVDDQVHSDGYYYYAKSKSKSKGSKSSKKAHRGRKSKRGKGRGSAELRYFEASLLLEMQDHYVAELSYLDLRQLETSVVDTYNRLSSDNCDLQDRQLIAAIMDPTPTSTGYILHMQGQCYGCDPSNVRVLAHPDDFFDDGEMIDDMMMTIRPTGGDGTGMMGDSTVPPSSTQVPSMMGNTSTDTGMHMGTDGTGTTTDMTMTGTNSTPLTPDMMATTNTTTQAPTASEPPPVIDANTTMDTAMGRNRGTLPRLQKKRKTFSKQRSRLQRSEDQSKKELEDAIPDFAFGLNAQSRAAYNNKNDQNRRRRLNRPHHHHHHHHHHHQQSAATIDANAEHVPQGAALNREPEIDEMELAEEDRADHYNYDEDPNAGLIMPYKTVRYGKSKSKKSKSSAYHPLEECKNDEATRRAPSEEEFVIALNHVTDDLLAQYNKLSIRSAVQVQTEPCSTTEEEFESSLVVQFRGPQGNTESLTPEEVAFAEQAILQTYNHLQATQSCDVPFFREMTSIRLRGIAPGPNPDTFLAMMEVQGTCRGDGCDDGATFFDPRDDDSARNRKLSHVRMPTSGFNSFLTRSGHEVTYDEGKAHVYQEQCYCPFKIEEFGPPFVSDMEAILDRTFQQATDEGLLKSVVSVVDIVEVTDDEVAYDPTTPPAAENPLAGFVVVQFFGQRDLVTEQEVLEIQRSIPLIYRNLQENSFCDPLSRTLESAVLQTVDPGPTEESFLLGFSLSGSCVGAGCGSTRMFFAPSGQQFVACGMDKIQGAPVIEDFENDLFQAILALRGTGDLVSIQASGDAVEVLPGGTPAPIFSGQDISAPAPTPAVATKTTFDGRSSSQNQYTYYAPPGPAPGKPQTTAQPTSYPTWLDTPWPTWYEYRRD